MANCIIDRSTHLARHNDIGLRFFACELSCDSLSRELGTGSALLEVKGGSMHYWFNDGHMVWMTLSWLVGIGLFLMLMWLLVLGSRGGAIKDSPEDILRRRYAAGDIETEEYERRLAELRKTKSAA